VDRLPREDSGKIKKRAVRQDMLDGRLQSQGR
jgi:acyl-coenzyme A synthetase/AMP-(fatty) acid ligase